MSTRDITLRSSAAEYLTFIASEGEREDRVEIRYEEENTWLTQKAMAQLYDVTVAAINQHIKKIFTDKELDEQAVIKKYLITANDGKHYQANHYNLQIEKYRMIQDKEYISDFDKFLMEQEEK